MNSLFPIQVRTLSGLENLLAEELSALGAKDIEKHNRVVVFRGDKAMLYRANIRCRMAIRVLRPLAKFSAPDEKALYREIQKIDWLRWLPVDGTLAIDAHVYSSFTTHSLFAAQLAKDAIVDQLRTRSGTRPQVDLANPQLRIALDIFENTAQICVDSSGESLHKRGYRQRAGQAPLKETLAAGILKLSGWDGSQPLLDPMCGSATLLIEAGLQLSNIAPGLLRKEYGFQRWKDYDAGLYQRLLKEAEHAVCRRDGVIVGLEQDPASVEIARQNIENAGLTGRIEIHRGDFFGWDGMPKSQGVLVVNPPYNERIAVEDIGILYQKIGDRFKQAYGGWRAYLLSGNLPAVKYVGLRSSRRIPLFNGPLECRLIEYELRASQKPGEFVRKVSKADALIQERVQVFANRIQKNKKRLSDWLKRENISSWRVYDWDIPELPFLVDVYADRLVFAEIPRNTQLSSIEQERQIRLLSQSAATQLGISESHLLLKTKARTRSTVVFPATVQEGKLSFELDLGGEPDDVFGFERRKLRARIYQEASGKDVLCLIGGVGATAVCAGAGKARSVTCVSSAQMSLNWVERAFRLNEIKGGSLRLVQADARAFLDQRQDAFDLLIVHLPTRFIAQGNKSLIDFQRDQKLWVKALLNCVRPTGLIFLSSSSQGFELNEELEDRILINEITDSIRSPDCHRPGFRCWLIKKV